MNLVRYDSKTGIQSLREFWVSQASAEQRKGCTFEDFDHIFSRSTFLVYFHIQKVTGRAGRTGPGICYRLYSKELFGKMDPFTPSEISRLSLASITMQIVNMNLGSKRTNVTKFRIAAFTKQSSLTLTKIASVSPLNQK